MRRALILVLLLGLLPWSAAAQAQDATTSITVELGDVSATKVPFIVAAESGIYARNGLTVTQFITPNAAENVRQSGFIVPPEFIKSGVVGDINIGGGSPTTLASGQSYPGGIAVDSTSVYWTTVADGTVMRVAK